MAHQAPSAPSAPAVPDHLIPWRLAPGITVCAHCQVPWPRPSGVSLQLCISGMQTPRAHQGGTLKHGRRRSQQEHGPGLTHRHWPLGAHDIIDMAIQHLEAPQQLGAVPHMPSSDERRSFRPACVGCDGLARSDWLVHLQQPLMTWLVG